jgi:transmembrane sensor
MNKEKFLALLSGKLSGEISSADSEALAKAIESNEEYQLLATELGHYFQHHKTIEPKIDRLNQIWEKIEVFEERGFQEHYNHSRTKRASVYAALLKVAAVLILSMGISWLGYRLLNRYADEGSIIMNATTQKTFRILDDGTRIWLNKKSTISYNSAFGKHRREIFLEGEAYFDVVKNKDIPLFIHAGNIDIEVKGTAFNVNAHKENAEIQVALIRGAIEVTDKLDKQHKVLLRPNEKLVFSNNSSNGDQNKFLVKLVGPSMLLKDTKWVSDTLIFNKEKLEDLIVRMEKKYEIKIEIQSDRLKDKRFSGTFINETIHQALAALKLSYPLTYTINDRLVVIKD